MKYLITGIKDGAHYQPDEVVGEVHLDGVRDTTACGLASEDFDFVKTSKPITCVTCLDFLAWAKEAAKQ